MFNFFKKNKSKKQVIAMTDVGNKMLNNEDAYLVINIKDCPYIFTAVADGMGGHEAGAVASQHIMKELHKLWKENITQHITHKTMEKLIIDTLEKTNQWIYSIYEKLKLNKTMGTTFTATLISRDYFTTFHTGDSRLYITDGKEVKQITEDHTWVQGQINKKLLTQEEAINHPLSSVLSNCIGVLPKLRMDLKRYTVKKHTRYLLCTDGLYRHLSNYSILKALSLDKPYDALNQLKNLSLNSGSKDNLTGIIIYT